MKKILLSALFVISASFAAAQTVDIYSDTTHGAGSTETIRVFTKDVDVLLFFVGSKQSDNEVGHTWLMRQDAKGFFRFGGYVANWPTTNNNFAIPFSVWHRDFGTCKFDGTMGAYIPVGHGPRSLFSDQISLTAPLRSGWSVGLASSFGAWQGSDPVIKVGMIATKVLSKNTTVSGRILSDLDGHLYGRILYSLSQ